jgi:hypothetical protein
MNNPKSEIPNPKEASNRKLQKPGRELIWELELEIRDLGFGA